MSTFNELSKTVGDIKSFLFKSMVNSSVSSVVTLGATAIALTFASTPPGAIASGIAVGYGAITFI